MSEGIPNRTMERMRVLEESLTIAHDKINSLEMALYIAKQQERELKEKISKYEKEQPFRVIPSLPNSL
jgi:hypothetical protein